MAVAVEAGFEMIQADNFGRPLQIWRPFPARDHYMAGPDNTSRGLLHKIHLS